MTEQIEALLKTRKTELAALVEKHGVMMTEVQKVTQDNQQQANMLEGAIKQLKELLPTTNPET